MNRNAASRGAALALVLVGGLALSGCAQVRAPNVVPIELGKGINPETNPRATSLSLPASAMRIRAQGRAVPGFFEATPKREKPYSTEDLVRNFITIALEAEAADDRVGLQGASISKWSRPILYRLLNAQEENRVQVQTLAARLTELTGLPIREAFPAERHNMDIRFVPRAYRAAEAAQIVRLGYVGPSVRNLVMNWRDFETDRCFALTTQRPSTGETEVGYIFIKAELPPLWRETCIVEEMAQSLGLLNDDSRVVPSVFNDDGRYLALTSHDEHLLRILYDPRIRSGMSAAEVEPIVRQIIQELRIGRKPGRA